MRDAPQTRAASSGEVRRLLALRARLREVMGAQPRAVQRSLLQAMDTARVQRQTGEHRVAPPPAMATDELIRELRWRLDVAGLTELEAAARVLDRAQRETARRRRRPPGATRTPRIRSAR